MALQDIPHRFSCMQAWQIRNPHRQDQQKGKSLPQQWHATARPGRCLIRYEELEAEADMVAFNAAIHHDIDAGGGQ